MSLQLDLGNGARIDEVIYTIRREGMQPMGGVIDTSAAGATASVEVFGLPPGDGYLIELRAIADDSTVCEGSAPFSVAADVSTPVAVMLNCKGPERFGSVRVNGELNVCTELVKAVISPLETSVGSTIDLRAQGEDAEGDTVRYSWFSSAGPIDDPSAPVARLTCATPGTHFVRIDVSDDGFIHCIDGWTVELRCVGNGGGAGGTGGSGGSAGTGGTAGSGGSGGTAGTGGTGGSVPERVYRLGKRRQPSELCPDRRNLATRDPGDVVGSRL